MASPAKLNKGDPLFSELTKQWCLDDKVEKNGSSKCHQDPSYMDVMIHSPKASLPLHSYYSEYRFGHGDPLMKAAMKRWPFTTVPDDNENPRLPITRALCVSPCHALLDLSVTSPPVRLSHDMMHMDDVGHLENTAANEERRFVLLSDERRFVVVGE